MLRGEDFGKDKKKDKKDSDSPKGSSGVSIKHTKLILKWMCCNIFLLGSCYNILM